MPAEKPEERALTAQSGRGASDTYGMKRSLVVLLALSMLLLVAVVSPIHAAEPSPNQVLVVTINLTETEVRDVSDTSDVDLFVERLVPLVPHAPDIVLAQEVRLESAENTAAALTKAYGVKYAIGVPAGVDPMWHKERRDGSLIQFTQESSVIFNTATMEMAGPPRFVRNSYMDGDLKVVRKHPYGTLREVGSELSIVAASIHMFRPVKISSETRATHAAQVAAALQREATATGATLQTMGGDFNEWRGEDNDPTPFYRTLLNDHGFIDAIPMRGVDYIFAKGASVELAEWGKDENDKAYSLHAFRWSLFGP